MTRKIVKLLLLATLAGCAHLVPMTPELIKQEGRMVYPGTKDKVFQATQDALDSLGVGVALAKPESGLIVSKRFVLAAYAARGRYIATANEDTIQYDISVKPTSDTEVEVLASPRGYHNNVEVTDREVWQLDGQQGQRDRWRKLFSEIKRMLGS